MLYRIPGPDATLKPYIEILHIQPPQGVAVFLLNNFPIYFALGTIDLLSLVLLLVVAVVVVFQRDNSWWDQSETPQTPGSCTCMYCLYMHVYIEYYILSTALIYLLLDSDLPLSFELTGCCWLQVVASSCDSALPASLAHGLQRSFQETGGRRQHGGQKIHGGQWAAAGGNSTHNMETPAQRTPDASHYTNRVIICLIIPPLSVNGQIILCFLVVGIRLLVTEPIHPHPSLNKEQNVT